MAWKARSGWRWRSQCNVLLALLQLVRHAHGDDERLWVVHLDIDAKRWPEASCERLHLLRDRQGPNAGEEGLEMVLVLGDSTSPLAGHEIAKRI